MLVWSFPIERSSAIPSFFMGRSLCIFKTSDTSNNSSAGLASCHRRAPQRGTPDMSLFVRHWISFLLCIKLSLPRLCLGWVLSPGDEPNSIKLGCSSSGVGSSTDNDGSEKILPKHHCGWTQYIKYWLDLLHWVSFPSTTSILYQCHQPTPSFFSTCAPVAATVLLHSNILLIILVPLLHF